MEFSAQETKLRRRSLDPVELSNELDVSQTAPSQLRFLSAELHIDLLLFLLRGRLRKLFDIGSSVQISHVVLLELPLAPGDQQGSEVELLSFLSCDLPQT